MQYDGNMGKHKKVEGNKILIDNNLTRNEKKKQIRERAEYER